MARQPETTVVHWNDRPLDGTYIGRPSIFGNPYVIGHGDIVDRRAAILAYRRYFMYRIMADAEFRVRVQELKGRVLICHCKPLACHGDVIKEWLDGKTAT